MWPRETKGRSSGLTRAGKAEPFFDSKQTHIMCLAFERDGDVLAGSVPKGLIYRITPQGKAFVLYESNLPEIHDLVTDSSGGSSPPPWAAREVRVPRNYLSPRRRPEFPVESPPSP